MKRSPDWFIHFRTIRARLLVGYFLLTVGTTVTALWTSWHVYCNRLGARAKASLVADIERFDRSIARSNSGETVTEQFDRLLADYVPEENEFVVTFINGQLYEASQPLPQAWLQDYDLIRYWADIEEPQRNRVNYPGAQLYYVAEPLVRDAEDLGVVVAFHDSTASYQSGTEAIGLVLKASVAVLGGIFVVVWIMAGRILQPLRVMNQIARTITETDMTERIPIQGSDEIARIAETFNDMLDRLQSAFDSQQEFLKDVSHELRTPITVIQGQLELLPYRPDKQPETLALIATELEHMNRLVNDLLLLTKADRPDFLILKPEDLDWLTEELFFKARSLTTERDWRLEAKGLYPVQIDRQRFSQAVMNLVQNAVHHTQPGNTIAMGSSVSDDWFHFWVRDAGTGIAEAERERIFERFARASNNNHPYDGAGLGLSIVSAIVRAHDGRVDLSSQLGQGSIFTLSIPLEPSNSLAEADGCESYLDCRRQSSHC